MSEQKKMTGIGLFTLWFGAAVSLAEIMTGSLLAPLGLGKGLSVILLGHLIGGLFLFLAGYIAYQEKKPALETSRLSLGLRGSHLVSILNITQLIGWTAIMLIQAAEAIQPLSTSLVGFASFKVTVVFLGLLVFFWSLKADKGSYLINQVSVFLLMILSLVMAYMAFGQNQVPKISSEMSLGLALELSIIMPLSWTPIIGDYTQHATSGKSCFWGAFLGYFIGSSLMYFIGFSCGMYSGSSNPIEMMSQLHFGTAALLVVILATVTTTFMDVYSAVLSTTNIFKKWKRLPLIALYCFLGTWLALYFDMKNYENFLYLIGSVFAPTFTVIYLDYFLFKQNNSQRWLNYLGFISISCGVAFYYWVQPFDLISGATLPTVLVTAISYLVLQNKLVLRSVLQLKNKNLR